jgi:hypothetical protein
LFKKNFSYLLRKKIHSYLIVGVIFLFLAGFLFRSKSSEFFSEFFIKGKWVYSKEYVDENIDTGQTWLAIDKEYITEKAADAKYLDYFKIIAYLIWLVPGILVFNEAKRLAKEPINPENYKM